MEKERQKLQHESQSFNPDDEWAEDAEEEQPEEDEWTWEDEMQYWGCNSGFGAGLGS